MLPATDTRPRRDQGIPRPARAVVAEIPGADLRRLAEAVAPHAAGGGHDQALSPVQWEIRGGALWLAAAAERTVGAARWQLPGAPGAAAGPVLVSLDETTALAGFAGSGDVRVAVDDALGGTVTVTRSGGQQARSAPWLLPPPGEAGDWRGILSGLLDGTPGRLGHSITFESADLPRFRMPGARAVTGTGGRPAELRFQIRRHRSTRELLFLVRCEDWFIGAIRPVTTGPHDGAAADDLIRSWPGWLAAGA